MYAKLPVVVLVVVTVVGTAQRRVDATDSHDVYDTSSQERPLNVQKRRLSLQDTGRQKKKKKESHVSFHFRCL